MLGEERDGKGKFRRGGGGMLGEESIRGGGILGHERDKAEKC